MNPIENQLVDSSRMVADIVVANIGANPELFDEAVALMMKDEYPLSMRASRVVYLVGEKHVNLLRKYIPLFIQELPKIKIDGVKRCLLGIFAYMPVFLSEDQLGELADISFTWLEDMKQPIAVRAISIDILLKVLKIYPELKPELVALLEASIPEASAGLKNKCRRTLQRLNKKDK
ncbi:MAG: hypothetical protein JXB49_07290 [Bacteroidales bacterium]|nr:hypothetical protein [Bacteroidales bacterium]MBN2821018.1 hypothetical protein [Bacteroidales bacterium]